jgi:hypothetical protein
MNSSRCPHPSKTIFVVLGLFLLLSAPFSRAPAAEAPQQGQGELLAIGDAVVVKGNSALAKKMAIAQALMKGVEDYVVQLLGTQGATHHFERVTEEIIPASQEAVENFHILAERQVDGRYKVLLKLRVNEEIIREKLQSTGVLLTETPPINLLLLVSEIKDGNVSYWWKGMEGFPSLSPVELALHKVFQARGFNPVNRTLSPPGAGHSADLTAPDLQDKDILRWGRLFSADVVVYGQCRITGGSEISLTVKALNVSQGIEVCQESITGQVAQAHGDTESFIRNLEQMANRLAASLCPCITGAVTGNPRKGALLTVTLAGITMPKQFWRLSSFLSDDVTGVTSVIPSGIRGNTMSATVGFQGDRSTFINRVLAHPKKPFPLRLNQTEQEAVVFNLE